MVDLEADAHLLRRADVAPAEDGEALGLEELVELVLHRVARGVELRPAAEEAGELEEEDVGDARLREAEDRDRGRVELAGADLLNHQVLVARLAVPLEVELQLAVRVVRHVLGEPLEFLAPGRVLRGERPDLERTWCAPATSATPVTNAAAANIVT